MLVFFALFCSEQGGGANGELGAFPRTALILPVSHHVSVKVSANFLKEWMRRDGMPRPAFRLSLVSKEPHRYAV